MKGCEYRMFLCFEAAKYGACFPTRNDTKHPKAFHLFHHVFFVFKRHVAFGAKTFEHVIEKRR